MTKKKAARKKTAKKAAKKKTIRKKAAKKKTKSKAALVPAGWVERSDGWVVPLNREPVSPAKIQSGLSKAQNEIDKLIKSLGNLTDGYGMAEIELSVSFSADGKFLGIGVGGATSIKIKYRPNGQ